LEGFFSTKIRNIKLLENAQIIKFQGSRGVHDIFLNCDNAELERSFKILFSAFERHRWAVSGLNFHYYRGINDV